MKNKLKTLKDFETWKIQSLSEEKGGRPIDEEELKAEAIKWVKVFRKIEYPPELEVFMSFFNITEEDLEEVKQWKQKQKI